MKNLFLLIFLSIPLIGLSQSYVFCPEIKTIQRQGFSETKISIVYKDSREYDRKLKEKCTKDEIFNSFTNNLAKTFPDFSISVLAEDQYDSLPQNGEVRLKLNLLKCDATFYPAVYVSNTDYFVTMIDNRKEQKIYTDTIKGAANQFNMWGLKSGKIALNNSFQIAYDKLVMLFDKLLPGYVQSYSSEEAIEELKKYKEKLDLQLITQEEYDKKKDELVKFIN